MLATSPRSSERAEIVGRPTIEGEAAGGRRGRTAWRGPSGYGRRTRNRGRPAAVDTKRLVDAVDTRRLVDAVDTRRLVDAVDTGRAAAGRRLRTARRRRRPAGCPDRTPGRVPIHPWSAPQRISRPAVDDPSVRRLRERDADQRAIPHDPERRRWRSVGCFRHADPDGPRLRRSAG